MHASRCAGRKYECDYGFVRGTDGLCEPFSIMRCGAEGQPVCSGDELNGATLAMPQLPCWLRLATHNVLQLRWYLMLCCREREVAGV